MIEVINKRLVPCDLSTAVLIDRTTIYGNPYKLVHENDRSYALELYEMYLQRQLDRRTAFYKHFQRDLVQRYINEGKLVLVCWCHPKPCHGDILAKYIELEARQC